LNDEDLGRTLFSGRVDCKSIASPSALTVHVSSESRYLPKDYLQISTESIESLRCALASFSCPSYYSRLQTMMNLSVSYTGASRRLHHGGGSYNTWIDEAVSDVNQEF
jgi:hypothetical protein